MAGDEKLVTAHDAVAAAGVTVPLWWQQFTAYANDWLPPILLTLTVVYFLGRAVQVWQSVLHKRNEPSSRFEEE